MMKTKDVSVAVALVLQGYLRSNEESTLDTAGKNKLLADAIAAARTECDQWAENLQEHGEHDSALEPNDLTIEPLYGQAPVSRTPYNLISAAVALINEAIDLNGEDALRDLASRGVFDPTTKVA